MKIKTKDLTIEPLDLETPFAWAQKQFAAKIQEEYKPKIDAARAQLDALVKEQNEKIAAVLTPEQKKKVEEAAANVKEKGAKPKAEQPATPAEKPAEK